jgi:hypothetical protein
MESELKDLKKKYRTMEEEIRFSQSQEQKNQENSDQSKPIRNINHL